MPKQEVEKRKITKKNHDKLVEKNWIHNITVQGGTENINENNSSVIIKSTRPKVVVQSEDIKDNCIHHETKIIKSMLLVVMCLIILITFFLSLRTYNMVNKLSLSLLN